jgi:DNA uptake protein ComE-like DNA-binding protein
MNRNSRRAAIGVAFSAAIMVAAAACGGGSDKEAEVAGTPTARGTTAVATVPAATATPSGATSPVATPAASAASRLNLNTATGDDYLATIPGFTDRFVREFLEYRPYVSIQQFRQEMGKYVDDRQIAEWERYVYVPVDINNSDAKTLMQIPGVDEAVANALIDGRDYASNEAFLAKLGEYVTGEQVAEAATILSAGS